MYKPDNGYETIPNSQLVIKHVVEKSSDRAPERSQYYINNKLSTYANVVSHLKNEGIDLNHKRFLILQVCNEFKYSVD